MNIPIPSARREMAQSVRVLVNKLDALAPGESFPLYGDEVKDCRNATQYIRRRDGNQRFALRHMGEGVHRVWRVESL